MFKVISIGEIVFNQINKKNKFSVLLRDEYIYYEWEKIVGKTVFSKSEPLGIKNNVLFVKVVSSVWINHLNFVKSDIIESVNKFLNGKYVFGITFVLGNIERVKKYKDLNKYKPKEEEIINLDDVLLDNFEISKIKSIIRSIYDGKNREILKKLYSIMIGIKKLEKKKISLGYKKCKLCGVFLEKEEFNNVKNECICFVCRNKILKERERKIYKYIYENPTSDFLVCKSIDNELTVEEYDYIRNKLLSNLNVLMKILKKEKNVSEFIKTAELYIIVESHISDSNFISERLKYILEEFHVKQKQKKG